MSLQLYEYDKDNNQYLATSENGIQTRPIQTTHDGVNGEVAEKKLYLRNSDDGFYFNSISLKATPDAKVRVGDANFNEAYIGYKIIFKENQPTKSEWAATQSGDAALIQSIGTTDASDTSYKSFWIQVNIPPGTAVGALKDIQLSLEADQHPIGG